MKECSKCGTIISDSDNIAWKCLECGKVFNVKFSKLKELQMLKDKPENIGKALLKCPACGKCIDNGNEKIACKCSTCGNVMMGDFRFFAGQKKIEINDKQDNSTYNELNTFSRKHLRKSQKVKKSIIFALIVVLIGIAISIPTIRKKYIENQATSLLKSELKQFSDELVLEDIFYNKEYNTCVIKYYVGYTEDTAVINLDNKTVGLRGVFVELHSTLENIVSSDLYSSKEKQASAQRVLEYPYDAALVYNLTIKGTSDGDWEKIK